MRSEKSRVLFQHVCNWCITMVLILPPPLPGGGLSLNTSKVKDFSLRKQLQHSSQLTTCHVGELSLTSSACHYAFWVWIGEVFHVINSTPTLAPSWLRTKGIVANVDSETVDQAVNSSTVSPTSLKLASWSTTEKAEQNWGKLCKTIFGDVDMDICSRWVGEWLNFRRISTQDGSRLDRGRQHWDMGDMCDAPYPPISVIR